MQNINNHISKDNTKFEFEESLNMSEYLLYYEDILTKTDLNFEHIKKYLYKTNEYRDDSIDWSSLDSKPHFL